MVLPVLLVITIGLVWVLSVGAAQLRVIDAARESARALARGDDPSSAVAAGVRVAPDGASVTVEGDGGQVVALASARIDGPGGLLAWLPGVTVTAEAVAVAEEVP
jgi:Flp pilus assembly protein TadG